MTSHPRPAVHLRGRWLWAGGAVDDVVVGSGAVEAVVVVDVESGGAGLEAPLPDGAWPGSAMTRTRLFLLSGVTLRTRSFSLSLMKTVRSGVTHTPSGWWSWASVAKPPSPP